MLCQADLLDESFLLFARFSDRTVHRRTASESGGIPCRGTRIQRLLCSYAIRYLLSVRYVHRGRLTAAHRQCMPESATYRIPTLNSLPPAMLKAAMQSRIYPLKVMMDMSPQHS